MTYFYVVIIQMKLVKGKGWVGGLQSKQIKGGGNYLVCGDVGDKRGKVIARCAAVVYAADGTDKVPGDDGAMVRAGEVSSGDEVEAPVDAYCCRSNGCGKVKRARVVGDQYAAAAEQTGKTTK